MQEFKVNDYITLRLEGKDTVIYVAGERFRHCKYLLINIPVDEVSTFDEIKSIDEAAERLNRTIEPLANPLEDYYTYNIPPEAGFWAHCSNLQLWWEHDYDTRLLHSNLAFPLLKKLTEVGDIQALKVFKEEIAKRLESAYEPVVQFLWNEGYVKYLTQEELSSIRHSKYKELKLLLDIEDFISKKLFWAKDLFDSEEEPFWFSMSGGKIVKIEISGIPELDLFPESITKLRNLTFLRMIENFSMSISF